MHRRRPASLLALLLLVVASLAVAAAPSPAGAAGRVTVRFGIGDQFPAMFADPRWQSMGLRITRYNVPWDAADDPAQLARATAFVQAAQAAGVSVLMHLTGRTTDGVREALPSLAAYRRSARKLVAIFRPMGVREWGAWNEENHPTQPTIRDPARAAEFFLELRRDCPGCTVVALDLLTQGGLRSKGVASYRGYATRFFAALGRKRSLVRVVGVHNYGELLEAKGPYKTRDLAALVHRYAPAARLWLTESGGIAANRSRGCDEQRQLAATHEMFGHAQDLVGDGVDRLYLYNWTAADCAVQFDSGLIRRDGTARPALAAVLDGASRVGR